jgi:hypothetical protein
MDHKSFRLSPVNFFKAYRDKHLQIGCGVFAGVFLLSLILISAIVRTESWGGLLFGAFALACVLSATFYFSQSSFYSDMKQENDWATSSSASQRFGALV